MHQDNNLEFQKLAIKYKNVARNSICTCYHPNCEKKAINTHILQKNGILSAIAPDRHLWKIEIDRYKNPHYQFKRKGIEKVFAFKGFCKEHDNDLFKEIETGIINFNRYDTFLKFSLRALYNEINRKEVIIKTYSDLCYDYPQYSTPFMENYIEQKKLGVKDFRNVEKRIWGDIKNGTESYNFKYRELPFVEICASGFYTYETTEEIRKYKQTTGEEYPEFTNIFISLFPFENELILQMGYPKQMEKMVKHYFNQFFSLNEMKVFRLVTNILLFSEIWVCSNKFYMENIKENERIFIDAFFYTQKRTNERKKFALNFLDPDFSKKLKIWHKNFISPGS